MPETHTACRHCSGDILRMILKCGTWRETDCSTDPSDTGHDIWIPPMHTMNMSCPVWGDGFMMDPTGPMFGFPIIPAPPGNLTSKEDGFIIRITDMSGIHMIPGDGTPITMDDGSGAQHTDGTGYRGTNGHRPGFPGLGPIIITVGVH